ncbi:hypothetical protein VitviT2T_009110 [Vitis vinifera]|uniref:HAT C-terminal dimerisation domain-containing protein n=1 Tax=Vitis vinifera TaxID=29760 RepID=A0ABY9C4J6_VITVI|nr:hypothetical protein VitviT2T_009110 [Vitis vinifera]
MPRTLDFDVLSWWKTNGIKYPTLQMIVRDIYAIPVSTVASKSAFSTSGKVVSKHRNRLHPNTLDTLMCAQSWLWKEKEGDYSIHDSQLQLTMMDEMMIYLCFKFFT